MLEKEKCQFQAKSFRLQSKIIWMLLCTSQISTLWWYTLLIASIMKIVLEDKNNNSELAMQFCSNKVYHIMNDFVNQQLFINHLLKF